MNCSEKKYSGRLSKKEINNNIDESSYDNERDVEFKKELRRAQDSIEVLSIKRRNYKIYSLFHKKISF